MSAYSQWEFEVEKRLVFRAFPLQYLPHSTEFVRLYKSGLTPVQAAQSIEDAHSDAEIAAMLKSSDDSEE